MKEYSLKERVVKNSFWSFSSAMINRFGALVFTIILIRFLLPEPESFGIYSIVLSTAMIFYTFTELGTNKAITRYISHALAKNKKEIPSYYHYLLKIKFFLSLSVALLLFIFSYPISFYFYKNPLLFLPLLVASVYIFIMAIESFYVGLFYSVEKAEFTTIRYSLEEILKITFALLVFYFVASTSYRVVGIFFTYAVISLLLLFFNLHYLKKLIPEIGYKSEVEIDKRKVRRFVSLLTVATISGVFFSYIDSVMLGFYLQPEFVGYYRAAYSLVFGIAGILGFPSVVLLPYFTKLNKTQISNIFNQSFRFLAIFSIPCIFGLIILGRYFIVLFFDYPFLPASLPLYFLAILIFPVVAVNLFLSLFSAEEKPGIFAKLILITSVLNIVLNFILINVFLAFKENNASQWATAGAAIATTASWLFYLFSFKYISRKKLGLFFSFRPVIKPLFSSVVMSVSILLFVYLVGDMGLLSGLIAILLGMLVYFISMYIMKGITIKDLNLVKIVIQHEKTNGKVELRLRK